MSQGIPVGKAFSPILFSHLKPLTFNFCFLISSVLEICFIIVLQKENKKKLLNLTKCLQKEVFLSVPLSNKTDSFDALLLGKFEKQ